MHFINLIIFFLHSNYSERYAPCLCLNWMGKNGNLPWICLLYCNTYIACIHHLCHVPTQNVVDRDRSSEDRETRHCFACDCGLKATMKVQIQPVWLSHKTRCSFPCPRWNGLKGSAGLYGRTFFIFTISILKQSVIMSQSHVQWRNPLCIECTTCLVCPCLPPNLNLIHDKFEPFALALPFCLLRVWHKFYTSA